MGKQKQARNKAPCTACSRVMRICYKGMCARCRDLWRIANEPGFKEKHEAVRIKRQANRDVVRRAERLRQKNIVPLTNTWTKVTTDDQEILSITYHLKDLSENAGTSTDRINKYLSHLLEDGFIYNFHIDKDTQTVTIFIKKRLEMVFFSGLSQKPPGVMGLE